MKDFLIGILPFRVFLVKVKTASGYRRRLKLGILISRGMWLLLLPVTGVTVSASLRDLTQAGIMVRGRKALIFSVVFK